MAIWMNRLSVLYIPNLLKDIKHLKNQKLISNCFNLHRVSIQTVILSGSVLKKILKTQTCVLNIVPRT